MQKEIESGDGGSPFSFIINEESLANAEDPVAGEIEFDHRKQSYTVINASTVKERTGLEEDQVEAALVELSISNSSWL